MEWAVKECGFVNLQSKISSVIFLFFFFYKRNIQVLMIIGILLIAYHKSYTFKVLEFRRIDLKLSMIY